MSRPREPPVYFIDHCLGRKVVVAALRAAGADARALVDEGFSEDAEDQDWLPVVAAKGWAIVTKDKRIARRPLERDAIVAARAGAFIVTAAKVQGAQIAALLVRLLPKNLGDA